MESSLTSSEYEQLVKGLVGALVLACQELGIGRVSGGRTNLILGKSGFKHQIDVSVDFPEHLLLIECKLWEDPVDAEAILTHAGRMRDILEANPNKQVFASVVSTQRATAGANTLSAHFGVNLDVATSFNEYVIAIVKRHFVGLMETARITDECDAVVRSRGG